MGIRRIEELMVKSVKELNEYFRSPSRAIPRGLLTALENDTRAGAQQLARLIHRRKSKNRQEGQRLRNLLRFEVELWNRGINLVAGVDEAGIAPLAGPVVAAAVILPRNYRLPGLDDSKKIANPARREQLAVRIKRDAVCWAVGRAEVNEIDNLNIYRAGLLAMKRAVESLTTRPDFVLVDARTIPQIPFAQRGLVHGDALSATIAAASIVAKTTRDAHMIELDRIHPGYGLASHKGYTTPGHLLALKQRGPLPIHRRSFAPVRQALGLGPVQGKLFAKVNDES